VAGFLFLGILAAGLVALYVDGPPLHIAPLLLIAILSVSLVGSLLVEAPFAIRAGRGGKAGAFRILGIFAIAQLATHTAIVAVLLSMSTFTLYTELKLERDLRFVPGELDAWVYYIDVDDGSLRRIRINGRDREQVLPDAVAPYSRWGFATTRLFVLPGENNTVDLWVDDTHGRPLLKSFAAQAGMFFESDARDPWRPGWTAADLRPQDQREWTITSGAFMYSGFTVRDDEPGKEFGRLRWIAAFKHPWITDPWMAQSISILPGGFAVMSLGSEQIVVVDVEGRRIGYLTRGVGPVVALESP
jgi:hypothetical protein